MMKRLVTAALLAVMCAGGAASADNGALQLQTLPPLEPITREEAQPTKKPDQSIKNNAMQVPSPGKASVIRAIVVNCESFVSLRARPSSDSERLLKVPRGEHVEILSNEAHLSDKDYFVEARYKGQTGYIMIEYLDAFMEAGNPMLQLSASPGAKGEVYARTSTDDIVMRGGPGTSYENLGLLFGGEMADYLGDSREDKNGWEWYHCRHLGVECWISSRYTKLRIY